MEMTNEMLIQLQVKAISALMAKLGVTEITLVDDDVKEAHELVGIQGDEIELQYHFNPHEGKLTLKMFDAT